MENSLTCALAEARFFSNSSASSSRFSMAGEILKRPLQIAKEMARPARVERATHCLEGSCSIQLSYGRNGQVFRTLPPQGQARLAPFEDRPTVRSIKSSIRGGARPRRKTWLKQNAGTGRPR